MKVKCKISKRKQTAIHLIQFQLFIFYKPACFTEKFSRTTTIHQGVFLGRTLYKQKPPFGAKIRIFVRGHCLFLEANSFPRATVTFEEQILSKDKYPSIFSPQMEAIVFIILQIFFATREVLKIGEYSRIFPSFSCGIFGHVTRLGQSRVSKKI